MKILLMVSFFFLLACNNANDEYKKPDNAFDAGRGFIENSLKGRYALAKKYMLQDQENIYWLDKVTKDYNNMNEQDKVGYSNSSINIKEVEEVKDSVTIINYSNSYRKRAQKVKVVKHNGEWLVDFKFTFADDM